MNKITKGENFAIIRPGDGEYAVMNDVTLTASDKWTFKSGSALRTDLHHAIKTVVDLNGFLGISCRTCSNEIYEYYMKTHPTAHFTYANIFVNANWNTWIAFMRNIKRPITYIGPGALSERTQNINIVRHIPVDELLVDTWDARRTEVITKMVKEFTEHSNQLYMISAGPIAKILVSIGMDVNDKNTYIDLGSCIDLYTKGSSNRQYYEGGAYSKVICDGV
jgi:hypothetical protein